MKIVILQVTAIGHDLNDQVTEVCTGRPRIISP